MFQEVVELRSLPDCQRSDQHSAFALSQPLPPLLPDSPCSHPPFREKLGGMGARRVVQSGRQELLGIFSGSSWLVQGWFMMSGEGQPRCLKSFGGAHPGLNWSISGYGYRWGLAGMGGGCRSGLPARRHKTLDAAGGGEQASVGPCEGSRRVWDDETIHCPRESEYQVI
jgi:hypothetical protein